MVSKLSTVEFIIGNISASGKLSAKMFGEYGIYCAEKWWRWSAMIGCLLNRRRVAKRF